MKAQLQMQSSPSIVKVVMKLTLLGGLVLGCVYVFLMLCSTAIRIFG